jgi:glycosyltransferase involved in cell wall biosynthesis
MRTLQIYSGNLFGGVESILCSLAEQTQLTTDEYNHFALAFDGPLSRRLEALGASVHPLGSVRFRNPYTIYRARRALRRLLCEHSFDVVICHSAWSQALFGTTIRAAGIPSIFWLHDAANGKHWLERLASRVRPDLVICNSHYTRGTLDRLYGGVMSEVLYPPLALSVPSLGAEERAEIRRGCDTTHDAVVIMQSSRMEPWKGHRQLLGALAQLSDDSRWVCWIAGSAQRPHEVTYVDDLRAMAEAKGIGDRVRFLGQRTDISRLLAAADIHCQPNVGAEPFGLAFIEALSAGRPVVTTDLGGAREIVDDTCGILVPPGDTARLAESLRRLIEDPGLRASLGARGPARTKKLCDPASQLALLHDIYSRVRGEVLPSTSKQQSRLSVLT